MASSYNNGNQEPAQNCSPFPGEDLKYENYIIKFYKYIIVVGSNGYPHMAVNWADLNDPYGAPHAYAVMPKGLNLKETGRSTVLWNYDNVAIAINFIDLLPTLDKIIGATAGEFLKRQSMEYFKRSPFHKWESKIESLEFLVTCKEVQTSHSRSEEYEPPRKIRRLCKGD